MKRSVALLLPVLMFCLLPLTAASATIGFSQNVQLLDDHGPFHLAYSSFTDGQNGCHPCTDGAEKLSTGTITIEPKTYQLTEKNKKYNYFLVDLTVIVTNQKGPRNAGFVEAKVQSIGSVNTATYSSGISQTAQNCHTYPLDIGAAFGPISVGTEVTTFSTCIKSSVSRSAVSRGQFYKASNLNGINNVTFQRFVRVKAGVLPRFKITITRPHDNCQSINIPSTGVQEDCNDAAYSPKVYKIGTTG